MVSDTFYTFKAVLKVTEHLSVQVKTGPFAEHSNQLWNISGVPTWSKVNAGLIKMYKAEVSDADEWNLSEHFAASDRSLCILEISGELLLVLMLFQTYILLLH